MDDEELMRRYYACEDDLFEEAHLRFEARLIRFFESRRFQRTDAEDLTQQVFVQVMNTKHHLGGSRANPWDPARGSLWTWIQRIAHHLACDEWARREKQPQMPTTRPTNGEGEATTVTAELPDEQPGPDDEAIAAERRRAVRDCLQRLPPRERTAMEQWLAAGHNPNLADLATSLGVSVPTAHRVVYRALDLMRECLGGESGAAP